MNNINNNQYNEEGEEQLIENTNNNENQNMENNNNFQNDNENENYEEENFNENEEQNEEDIENNKILQEIDENIINNENIDEDLKNFIATVKDKLMILMQENNDLKVMNFNLINLNQENTLLKNKMSQLQNMVNKYKLSLNQKSTFGNNKGNIILLNNKINQYQIALSKSIMEKKLLESKLDNYKNDFIRQINLMNNLKNNQLQSIEKRLNEMKNNEVRNNNDFDMNKRMLELKIKEDSKFYGDRINNLQEKNEKISSENIALDEENKNLKNIIQKNNLNLKYKDGLIKTLNEKIKQISDEYKSMVDSLVNNNEQSQFQINQLFDENDRIKKDRDMLILEMNKLRENFANYNNEAKQKNKILENYRNKLNKYKTNIIILKQRINELLTKNAQNRIDNEYNNIMKFKSSNNFFKP